MEIMTLKYGESSLPESMIFVNGHTEKKRNIIFNIYLIRENNKMILVDAGCETMPGFVMKNFIGPIKALKNINVDPEEITDVIITHSHHDHIECVKYFKNAVIHIENSEYQHGKKYIPGNFVVNKFIRRFTICEDVTVIKIGGHSIGSCIVEVKKSNKIYIIAGDECYLRECLEKKIPTGNYYDKSKSEAFIEKYSDKKYEVLLCHDV